MADWTRGSEPALGGTPIMLSPRTYARHAAAVAWVESLNRARIPRPKRGKTTTPSAGAWGFLQPGDVIEGISGMTLGTGVVTLCSREDADLTPDGDEVTVYNPSRRIKAGPAGVVLRLTWMDGDWCPVIPNFAVGKAAGAITPRINTHYGTGLVDLYESTVPYGYGYGDELSLSDTIAVLNASADEVASGISIAAGKYVSVAWDAYGVAWVAPLEC